MPENENKVMILAEAMAIEAAPMSSGSKSHDSTIVVKKLIPFIPIEPMTDQAQPWRAENRNLFDVLSIVIV